MPDSNSFPSLEYDLASKKWRILIFWTLVIMDSFAIPIILYFVLNYSTTLDKKQGIFPHTHRIMNPELTSSVYYIISFTLFGTLMLEYAQRAWRLWVKTSTCRVVNTKRLDVSVSFPVFHSCLTFTVRLASLEPHFSPRGSRCRSSRSDQFERASSATPCNATSLGLFHIRP